MSGLDVGIHREPHYVRELKRRESRAPSPLEFSSQARTKLGSLEVRFRLFSLRFIAFLWSNLFLEMFAAGDGSGPCHFAHLSGLKGSKNRTNFPKQTAN